MVKIRAVRFTVSKELLCEALRMPPYSNIRDISLDWDEHVATFLVEHPDLAEIEVENVSQVPFAKPTITTIWKWDVEDGNGKEESTS